MQAPLHVLKAYRQTPRLGYEPGLNGEKLLERLEQDKSHHSAIFDLLREAKTWTFGADVISRTVYEDEDFLVNQVAKALSDGKTYDFSEDEADLASRMPAHQADEYHRRFQLAVAANPIREDRFAVHQRATALLRVAVLEVGQRAKSKGCLKEPEHALAAGNYADLSSLLQEKQQPGREAECARMEKAYGRLSSMAEKDFVPESLPLGRIPKRKETSQSSTSTWPEYLFKLSGYLPEISLVLGVEMLWDWNHLDRGRIDVQPVSKSASPDGPYVLGMSVDDLAGQVEGIARVGLPGLQQGEILVVKETSASYVKYFPRLGGLVIASEFTLPTLSRGHGSGRTVLSCRHQCARAPCLEHHR